MTHRIWVGRPVLFGAAALALLTSLAFSACYTGDQSCAEAYNQNDPNDHCPYGPPGGPKVSNSNAPDCPLITKLDAASDECKLTFADVYPRMIAADGGNCSNNGTGCHSSSIKGIAPFKEQDPQSMLDALSVYKGEIGRKYYDPDASEKSWWVCNLRGDAGKLMPTGATPRMTNADIALVEKWLACGGKPAPAASMISGQGGGGSGGSNSGGSGGCL